MIDGTTSFQLEYTIPLKKSQVVEMKKQRHTSTRMSQGNKIYLEEKE